MAKSRCSPPSSSSSSSSSSAAASARRTMPSFLLCISIMLLGSSAADCCRRLVPARRGGGGTTTIASFAPAVVSSIARHGRRGRRTAETDEDIAPHPASRLFSLLKPAAVPLMDSGKALARSGELLIDLTSSLDMYGGSLSAAGACIRNCGDCIAQAAASCRFKTASELVIDELREGAECLREGGAKLTSAVKEGEVDPMDADALLLATRIGDMIRPTALASAHLEEAGASVMRRESIVVVGKHLSSCGEALGSLAAAVRMLDQSSGGGGGDAGLSAGRMEYASEMMIVAGRELTKEEDGIAGGRSKGKSWIKG